MVTAKTRMLRALLPFVLATALGCTKGQEGDLNNRTNNFGMDDACLWARGTIDVGTPCPGTYPCPEGTPAGQCQCPQTGVLVGFSSAQMVIGEGEPPVRIVFRDSFDIQKQFSAFTPGATQLDAYVCFHQEAPGSLTGDICGIPATDVLPWYKYAWLVNEDETTLYFYQYTGAFAEYDNPTHRDQRGRTWREDQEYKGSTMTMEEMRTRLEASRARNSVRPATDNVLTRDAASTPAPWRGAAYCGPLQ